MHSALLALLASVTIPAAPAPVRPPAATATTRAAHQSAVIKVWTEWDQYSRGDEANVSVRTRDDGYLIVMQADVDGRVRVIFPIDPGDDDFVRGGHDIKLKGRNGKGAFYVDGPGGMGMVYAAISPTPFRFNDFVQNDHWDYGALYDKTLDADFENGFTVLVDKMSTGHFDYDVYRYEVIAHTSYAEGGGGYAGPPVYAGSPCWATPYDPNGCFGPNWIPGTYMYGGGPWGYGYGYAPYYPASRRATASASDSASGSVRLGLSVLRRLLLLRRRLPVLSILWLRLRLPALRLPVLRLPVQRLSPRLLSPGLRREADESWWRRRHRHRLSSARSRRAPPAGSAHPSAAPAHPGIPWADSARRPRSPAALRTAALAGRSAVRPARARIRTWIRAPVTG